MQTKKFLLYKIIPWARLNHATGRFWPAGRMFDTPGLTEFAAVFHLDSSLFDPRAVCSTTLFPHEVFWKAETLSSDVTAI